MKTTAALTLPLLAAAAACDRPSVAETSEYELGREIIETFAEQ